MALRSKKMKIWPLHWSSLVARPPHNAALGILDLETTSEVRKLDTLTIDNQLTGPSILHNIMASTIEQPIVTSLPSTTAARPSMFKRILRRLKPKKAIADQNNDNIHGATSNGDTSSHVHLADQQSTSLSYKTASSVSSSSSSLSQNSDDSEVDIELYWGPIPYIATWRVRQLVLRLVGQTIANTCWVHDIKQGAFNHVFIVMFGNGSMACLKIPATGWTKRWTPEDAADLRREALTLKYMRQQLGAAFPSPELLGYDTTMDNEIGAPYILMTCLPGKSGVEAWFESKFQDNECERTCHREKILTSLAQHMAKLRAISLPAIGVLEFDNDECDNPHVVPEMRSRGNYDDSQDPERPYPKTWTEIETHTTTESFFKSMIDNNKLEDNTADRARRAILHAAGLSLPYSLDPSLKSPWKRKEVFSLSHDDLDLQNILCDDDGNVTGIFDWERVTVRPNFMGWCTTPLWIREDMDDGVPWPFNRQRFQSPVQMADFRRCYHKALDDAIGYRDDLTLDEKESLPKNDADMSHLGHSLYDGLRSYDAFQLRHFCDVLATLIFPGTSLPVLYRYLGKRRGSQASRQLLEEEGDMKALDTWMLVRAENIMNSGLPWELSWRKDVETTDIGTGEETDSVDDSYSDVAAIVHPDNDEAVLEDYGEGHNTVREPPMNRVPSPSSSSSRCSSDGFDHSDTASTRTSISSLSASTFPTQQVPLHALVRSDGYANLVTAARNESVANKHLHPLRRRNSPTVSALHDIQIH